MPQFTPLWNAAPPNAQRSPERLRLGTWGVGLQAPSHAWPGHVLRCRREQLQGQECCVPDPRTTGNLALIRQEGQGNEEGAFPEHPTGVGRCQGRPRRPGSADSAPSSSTQAEGRLLPSSCGRGSELPALESRCRRPPAVPAPGGPHPSLRAALWSLKRGAGVAWVGGECAVTAPRTRSRAHAARSATGLTPLLAVRCQGLAAPHGAALKYALCDPAAGANGPSLSVGAASTPRKAAHNRAAHCPAHTRPRRRGVASCTAGLVPSASLWRPPSCAGLARPRRGSENWGLLGLLVRAETFCSGTLSGAAGPQPHVRADERSGIYPSCPPALWTP